MWYFICLKYNIAKVIAQEHIKSEIIYGKMVTHTTCAHCLAIKLSTTTRKVDRIKSKYKVPAKCQTDFS